MSTPKKHKISKRIYNSARVLKKIVKLHLKKGCFMSLVKMAPDIGISLRCLKSHAKDLLALGLIKIKKRLCKNRIWYEPSKKAVTWYQNGGDERLFISLCDLPQICTTEPEKTPQICTTDAPNLHDSLNVVLFNVDFSFKRSDMKEAAAPPLSVHTEQKEKKAKQERLTFEQIAQNMVEEGLESYLIDQVCQAVRTHKTPIYSPDKWMRKVYAQRKQQTELKFARMREKYAPHIPHFKAHAGDMLAYQSHKVTWKWIGDKVKVSRRGDDECRTFTIDNPNNLMQLRNWIGAY